MDYLSVAKNVLNLEAKALNIAAERLSEGSMTQIVELFERVRAVGGKLVFCGIGKSGLIAQKLAATFCSLGQAAFFLHPVEALHGDLGLVGEADGIVFLSKSGTTEEILKLIPFIGIEKKMRIALVGNSDSPIARKCGIVLDCSVETEACINNMAPTTSSTLSLAMGDALAVVYENMVGLSQERFAENHPGGILGKSLLMKVEDLMWDASECPVVSPDATLQDIILEMTRIRVGGCAVIDSSKRLHGIIVEGDIRRTFTKESEGLKTRAAEILNSTPVSIDPKALAYDAMRLMEDRENEIDILPVIDDRGDFLGFIRLHDLLKEGFSAQKS